MPDITTDLCVIGGGSGGLSLAAGAVQMGARVVLLEGGEMGGDCLNHGCVPSKSLLAAAKAAHAMQAAGGGFGIAPARVQIDAEGVRAHVAGVIAAIAPNDSQERFERLGVTVIREYGRFVAPDLVQAGAHRIRARRFVIATGSRPLVPAIPGLAETPFLTNESIFDLPARPEHLIILGGGPVGLEMAQAHHRLGSRVTLIEAARALSREEPDLAQIVLAQLRAEGIAIREHSRAARMAGQPGAIEVGLEGGEVIAGSHLLVATGRSPNIDALDLEAAGIRYSPTGVTVSDALRTSNRRVYAIGDAAGRGQFTHLAGYHAGVVIRSILLGLPARVRNDHIPRVTYTDPELAHIGLTESEARHRFGAGLSVQTLPIAENDRARAERISAGAIKLMVVRGRPVGVGIAGPHAGEMIGIWSLAIAGRMKLSAIAETVLPYPTLGELNKRAAGAYFSPKLFDNPMVRRVVRLVQAVLP